jgi:hypothetical protein
MVAFWAAGVFEAGGADVRDPNTVWPQREHPRRAETVT